MFMIYPYPYVEAVKYPKFPNLTQRKGQDLGSKTHNYRRFIRLISMMIQFMVVIRLMVNVYVN